MLGFGGALHALVDLVDDGMAWEVVKKSVLVLKGIRKGVHSINVATDYVAVAKEICSRCDYLVATKAPTTSWSATTAGFLQRNPRETSGIMPQPSPFEIGGKLTNKPKTPSIALSTFTELHADPFDDNYYHMDRPPINDMWINNENKLPFSYPTHYGSNET
ncbi:3603_t:CDS:2 [Acaulospora colombiana]|uniref:3603_t:CDS:1 n=1 Tax=Acaulospora colombiana TaxID=27376 RepID=A0ACA9PS93_9GLOM|nr:3603_t:CDS:2 [Acaulospora colombiana]